MGFGLMHAATELPTRRTRAIRRVFTCPKLRYSARNASAVSGAHSEAAPIKVSISWTGCNNDGELSSSITDERPTVWSIAKLSIATVAKTIAIAHAEKVGGGRYANGSPNCDIRLIGVPPRQPFRLRVFLAAELYADAPASVPISGR